MTTATLGAVRETRQDWADSPHAMDFAGERLLALPDRALFWPRRQALLVADLHLEKASWFARDGQMLPPFDSQATISRLAALALRMAAQEIWALGDSFHDAQGPGRLPDAARGALTALAASRRIIWITGNHDEAASLPGESVCEQLVDGLMLRHEACSAESHPEISGHFHPKLRVRGSGRTIARPCFIASGRKIILPAFGALTGGLDADHSAIRAAVGPDATALVATSRKLLRFALAA